MTKHLTFSKGTHNADSVWNGSSTQHDTNIPTRPVSLSSPCLQFCSRWTISNLPLTLSIILSTSFVMWRPVSVRRVVNVTDTTQAGWTHNALMSTLCKIPTSAPPTTKKIIPHNPYLCKWSHCLYNKMCSKIYNHILESSFKRHIAWLSNHILMTTGLRIPEKCKQVLLMG